MLKILFVCWGNICRSPMAEYVMKDLVNKNHCTDCFEISSAAVSTEEIGNSIYPPARRELQKHNILVQHHSARQINMTDYLYFDRIYYMDSLNKRFLQKMFPDDKNKIMPFLDRDVEDPWYTGDFSQTWIDILEGCRRILEENQ